MAQCQPLLISDEWHRWLERNGKGHGNGWLA
jgi:hypothetical protein